MGTRIKLVVALVVVVALIGSLLLWLLRPGVFVADKPPATETVATGTRDAAAPVKPAVKREHVVRIGSGVVVGSVRVYGKDTPVGAAKVTLSSGDATIETVTQPDGSFAVARVPKADSWTLQVAAAEDLGEAKIGGVVVVERKTTDVGVVYLAPGFAAPGIVEDERGRPIPGADVSVSEPRPTTRGFDFMSILRELPAPFVAAQTTKSGEDGRFRLTGLPPGTYTVVARKSGFATSTAHSVLVAPSAREPIRLVMATGHRVDGRVVRGGEGPLEGLTVVAFPQNDMESLFDPGMPGKAMAKTDAKGAFALEGLAAGRWQVIVAPEGEAMSGADEIDVPKKTFVELKLAGGATLSGRVTNEADAPVAGANVYAAAEKAMAHGQTDADGRYVLRGLPAGSLQMFMVTADGYCPYPSEGFMAMAMGGEDKSLALVDGANTRDAKLSPGGKFRGTVVEQGATTPVPGATVSLMSPASMMTGGLVATTGDDGKFEIAGVAIGPAAVIVKKSGWCQADAVDMKSMIEGMAPFGGEKKPDEKDPGTGSKIVLAKQGDVVERTIGLVRAGVLKGRVLAASGEPVVGARVTAKPESSGGGNFLPTEVMDLFGGDGETRLSDADGRFEITSPVAKGKVVLSATAAGRLPAKSGEIEIGGATPPAETELRLGAGGTIEGRVADKDGEPVEGATVLWRAAEKDESGKPGAWSRHDGERPTTTGADGGYRISAAPPGAVDVFVRDGRHVGARRDGVAVEEGKTSRVDVTLEPGLSITGRVTRVDGKPVKDVWVEVRREGAAENGRDSSGDEMTIADDGRFHVDALTPGQYRLTARAQSAADGEPVVVAAGTDGVEIRLAPQLAIAGFVKFRDGRPAAGVTVTARSHPTKNGDDAESDEEAAETGPDGAFRIEGVKAGAHDVVAEAPPAASTLNMIASQVKDVAAGAEGVVITVETGLTITGRVLGPDGAPVATGRVCCAPAVVSKVDAPAAIYADAPSRPTSPTIRVAEVRDGRFELTALVPATYSVTIDRLAALAPQTMRVDAGRSDVVFHLTRGGTIKGRVVRPDGTPAARAEIEFNDGPDAPTQPSTTTDEDGFFTCECVAPGGHRLTAYLHDRNNDRYKGDVKDVRIGEGETAEHVEIRLTKSE